MDETNGVSVVMSSADVKINKRYRFSKFISFCVWHVPEGSVHTVSVALDPVKICGGSRKVRLPDSKQSKIFLSAVLIVFVNLTPPGDFPDNHGNPRKSEPVSVSAMKNKNKGHVAMWRECELNQGERDLLRIFLL